MSKVISKIAIKTNSGYSEWPIYEPGLSNHGIKKMWLGAINREKDEWFDDFVI